MWHVGDIASLPPCLSSPSFLPCLPSYPLSALPCLAQVTAAMVREAYRLLRQSIIRIQAPDIEFAIDEAALRDLQVLFRAFPSHFTCPPSARIWPHPLPLPHGLTPALLFLLLTAWQAMDIPQIAEDSAMDVEGTQAAALPGTPTVHRVPQSRLEEE